MNECRITCEGPDGERHTLRLQHPHFPCSDLRERAREMVPVGGNVVRVQCGPQA